MSKAKKAPPKQKKPSAREQKEAQEQKRELNLKQKDFVREYLLCRNASEAHRRTYGSKNPDVDGPRLLGNAGIKAMLAEEEKSMQSKYEATRDELIGLLAGIALLDPLDVLDQDEDGITTFKKLRHMPKQARLAFEIWGNSKRRDPNIMFKSISKEKAVEQLSKYLGLENGTGSGAGADNKRAAIERLREHLNKRLRQG